MNEYLTVYGPDCKARITHHFATEVSEFTYLIKKLQDPLLAFSKARTEDEAASPRDIAYGLMYKGANALMASFELALAGYHAEPPILLRNAMEVCATGWDLVTTEKVLERWTGGKLFKSTESISRLSKVDAFFGKFWGYLSTERVHTTKRNATPPQFRTSAGLVFQPYGFVPVGKEEASRFTVELVLIITHACLQLVETAYYPFVVEPEAVKVGRSEGFVEMKMTDRFRRFVDSWERTCALVDEQDGH